MCQRKSYEAHFHSSSVLHSDQPHDQVLDARIALRSQCRAVLKYLRCVRQRNKSIVALFVGNRLASRYVKVSHGLAVVIGY